MDEYYCSDDEYQETNENELIQYMRTLHEDVNNFFIYVDSLWENVIVPYIENSNEQKILTKLTIHDKHKFIKFMVLHCEGYKKLQAVKNYSEKVYPIIEDVMPIKKFNI